MNVKDIVSFSKESFFNGAVQTEWFYDSDKVEAIANSYVFHGPKYYGVTSGDVKAGEHRLMDTASFAKNIAEKLCAPHPNNSFVMTIAGYGSGKSHLAVCLGALFAKIPGISDAVTQNIYSTDEEIGSYISKNNTKRNLVIVLNGMNNFNLDAEILHCARLSLMQQGINDDFLKKLTKSYDIAKHFVDRTYQFYQTQFERAAAKNAIQLRGDTLKKYLISNVEESSPVLNAINAVYAEVNGDSISWDRGLSAGDVLLTIQAELCGPGKPFNKILLLFDEFGRYIEYTAANPAIAGEAALQQIFEAIQTANGNIIFAGFIQSELDAYLSRISKTSNITRYLERYRTASENLFLSSNFETILANIIKKNNPDFERVVGGYLKRYGGYQNRIKENINRWDKNAVKKGVWTSRDLYESVILNGCYPLHPITVWLLSNSHQWMQQRSTLAFASEMYDTVAEEQIDSPFLPYVFPYQVVDSGIFNEMLNSEEKGLVPSQFCMLYRDIMVKVGNKLSDLEDRVLKAVLIINMGKMSFYDREDAISALTICSNLQEDEVKHALKTLEEMHGVVAFDSHSKTYDLIAEANGFNDFKRTFIRYKMGVQADISDIDEQLSKDLSLDITKETSFALDNHISSTEWVFEKILINSRSISENFLEAAVRSATDNCTGETPRGTLVFAYCEERASFEAARLSNLYKKLDLQNYPVIILFLDDNEKEIISSLCVKKALLKFSAADRERFRKHISDNQRKQNNKICKKFTQCVHQNLMVSDEGLVTYSGRLGDLCSQTFAKLYTSAVPFVFDGFENKNKTQAKQSLTTLCCNLYNRTLTNQQVYNSLSPKDKNRALSCLSTQAPYSWKVFNNSCQLVEPGNIIVREILQNVKNELEDGKLHKAFQLFYKYVRAPYGMNENSLSLLIAYFGAYEGKKYYFFYGTERMSAEHWGGDKGKLKIPELRKISIQLNPNADVNMIEDICQRIIGNTDVEQCGTLQIQFDSIIAQEEVSDSNKYIVAQAQTYLENGVRLAEDISNKIATAQKILDMQAKNFNALSFVKVFTFLPDTSLPIEDGLAYQYNSHYVMKVLQAKAQAQSLLQTQFVDSLKKISCKITELSQCKMSCKRAAEILRVNHCDDYAEALNTRMMELEELILARQKYETSIAECERDINQSASAASVQELEMILSRFTTWQSFWQEANLSSEFTSSFLNKLNRALETVKKKKDSLLDDYADVIRSISTAQTEAELKRANSNLDRLLKLQFNQERQDQIIQIQSEIKKVFDSINGMPVNLDELGEYLEKEESSAYLYGQKALHNSIADRINELGTRQANWMAKYVEEVSACYQTLSAAECQRAINVLDKAPDFFEASAYKRIESLRCMLETQLHKSKVEGLLVSYNALNDEEKAYFKMLIKDH